MHLNFPPWHMSVCQDPNIANEGVLVVELYYKIWVELWELSVELCGKTPSCP